MIDTSVQIAPLATKQLTLTSNGYPTLIGNHIIDNVKVYCNRKRVRKSLRRIKLCVPCVLGVNGIGIIRSLQFVRQQRQ